MHADVFLDALDARLDQDYRKTILYAAIAVEAMTTTTLDAEYERIRQLGTSPQHRLLPGNAGELPRDPVFRQLRQRANAQTRLDTLPLYLFGRSLRADNEPLFNRAMRLSGTRNALAHTGEGSQQGDTLPLDREGAAESLAIARDVFAWFGVDHDYPVVLDHAEIG